MTDKKVSGALKFFREEVPIPSGINVTVAGTEVTVKGTKGELKRGFLYPGVNVEKTGDKITITSETKTKPEKAIVNTFVAHLNNMIAGVTKGFKYKMKIVYSHFPITVKVVGTEVEITNYFGEKRARRSKIIGNVKVTATKEDITIEGANVEDVGQTMSNLEQVTRIRYKDQRIFQDGIYLTNREA